VTTLDLRSLDLAVILVIQVLVNIVLLIVLNRAFVLVLVLVDLLLLIVLNWAFVVDDFFFIVVVGDRSA
jgi:hypothetical protein